MLSRQIIMTVVAAAALALAFAACAAQAQSPLAAQDHHKRGLALGQSGELDLAIAEFDKAIELSPRLADAWCKLSF
jgi:tetratricopeptide (TPR) repeat protein